MRLSQKMCRVRSMSFTKTGGGMEFAGINKRWPKLSFDIKAVLGSLWISYSFAEAPNPPSGNMNLIVDNAVGLIGRYQRNG
jgi:hypothetical protein